MKLTQEQRTIERSGDFRQSNFRIAANAHAFEILSSRLYTDTRLAIVRELSTNAADSHIEAGNADKPFDVHLPNAMEPYFSIRDYGTGLSKENVETIYTTYFESTRNNSNDFTGALGLGSKSPFAYTDMFTVTSYHEGTMYVYSAFKGETGEPSIALVSETKTNKPNGLEIRIAIKPGDEHEFSQKAQQVYRFFKVRPNVTGARIEFPECTPKLSGSGWELYDGNAHARGKISVVMGNVCYAASRNKILHKLGYTGELVLHVPIGECSIAANREELQYDDRTIINLQKRVDKAQAEARKQINDSIGASATLLDKLIALKQFGNLLDFPIQDKTIPTKKDGIYKLRKLEMRGGDKLFIGYDRFDSELRPGHNSMYTFIELDVDNPDDPKSIKQKLKNNLRHWMQQRGSSIYYLATIEDSAEFEKTFGKPTIKLTDIPDAPRIHSGGGSGGTRTYIKRLEISCRYRERMCDMWENVLVTDKDPLDLTDAIAVPRKGYYTEFNGVQQTPSYAYSVATALGYNNIYGLPMNRYDKMREELGLDDLTEMARSHIENVVKTADDFTRAVFHHYDSYHDYNDEFLKAIDGLSPACTNLVKFLKTPNTPEVWRRLLRDFKLTMPAAENYLDTFKKRYPLIARLELRYVDLNDVLEYIKLKEKK